MKGVVVSLVACLVVGCQMPEPPKVEPAKTAEAAKPADKGGPSGDPTPATPPPPAKPGENPYRIYQLASLQKATVAIAGHSFKVWVMDTVDKDREGMMWLKEGDVKADEGMIFPSTTPIIQSFWMQNTLIPLDIVFVSPERKVLNVGNGKPLEEKIHVESAGQSDLVIELKAGTCKRLGIRPGASVVVPSSVKAVR